MRRSSSSYAHRYRLTRALIALALITITLTLAYRATTNPTTPAPQRDGIAFTGNHATFTAAAPITSIEGGPNHVLLLHNDGTLSGWGSNTHHQLTPPTTLERIALMLLGDFEGGHHTQPVMLPATSVTAVAVGTNHSLALHTDGSVSAWGDNTHGQLGSSCSDCRHHERLDLPPSAAIAAGYDHAHALTTQGHVISWGAALLTHHDTTTPTPVPQLERVQAIAAGRAHALALHDDGSVSAWGANGFYELGVSASDAGRAAPVPVPGPTRITQVSAGHGFSLALDRDGRVWSWGEHTLPRGDGTYQPPRLVRGLNTTTRVHASALRSAAVTSDGEVVMWGWSDRGQLQANHTSRE